jgi:hypothetical protein
MKEDLSRPQSRRDFIGDAGALGAAAAIVACSAVPLSAASVSASAAASHAPIAADQWDFSWVTKLASASDRAVFDAPEVGGGLALEAATHYLDNCDAVYGAGHHSARAVVNLRMNAIAIALDDSAWERYKLGSIYDVQDPATAYQYDPTDPFTWKPAIKNPFLTAERRPPGTGSLDRLVERKSIVLVCDFALGRLAARLAKSVGGDSQRAHSELRSALIPGAVPVPSGSFALVKAQNAGCAFVPFPS